MEHSDPSDPNPEIHPNTTCTTTDLSESQRRLFANVLWSADRTKGGILSFADDLSTLRLQNSCLAGYTQRCRLNGVKVADSVLLQRDEQKAALRQLFDDRNVSLTLLYRGSRDTFAAKAFHQLCDNKGATLVVVKTRRCENVFGGFATSSWVNTATSCLEVPHIPNPGGWLFVLQPAADGPGPSRPPRALRFDWAPGFLGTGLRYHSECGPIFGRGDDLFISDQCDVSWNNFVHPWDYCGGAAGAEFTPLTVVGVARDEELVGRGYFQVKELEVFGVAFA